ncbi:MAG: hypothetical protein KA205_05495 [Acidobacteria bacterium]|jgi:hypothetical protein|nr:hypothetical protein [Acidobacteriota bacterium]
MRTFTRLAAIAALTMSVAACEAQCSVSTASLSEEAMASAVNPETKAPIAQVTSFAPDASTIYATAKLTSAPEGTKVKAEFHYLEGGDRQIAQDEVTADGTRYVMFTLSPPTNGWPSGQYETRFFLNGKEGKRLPFNIATRAAAPEAPTPTAAPAPPPARAQTPTRAATGLKTFRDDAFGFSLELPDTFTYRVTPQKHYMFEGPKGADAYELSIILQFVTKSQNPGSSAEAQLRGLADELARAPNGTIRTRDTIPVGGTTAPFVSATYDAKDSGGTVVPFGHTQMVVDHGAYYYLISYSGPLEIFKKYMPTFEHLIESWTFTR